MVGFDLISKQHMKTYDDELLFLHSLLANSLEPPPSTDAIIVIDDEEETLDSNNKKRKRNMETERQESNDQSQTGQSLISKQCSTADNNNDELRFFNSPIINSFGSPLSTAGAIIFIDDDEEETLDSKKKPRLGYSLGNEVSCVVEGSLNNTDVASRVDSCFSSTDLHHHDDWRSLLSTHHDFVNLSVNENATSIEDLKNMPWEAFDPTWEIRELMMDPWLGGYMEAMLSPPQNLFTKNHESQNGLNLISKQHNELQFLDSTTFNFFDSPNSADDPIIVYDDDEEGTQELENKKKKQRLNNDEVINEVSNVVKGSPKAEDVTTAHRDDLIDQCVKESVSEDANTSNKGSGHVAVEELGVSVEDHESMLREAFDSESEIRELMMDPWLGSYVEKILYSR